ncbi:MAG TPA: VWA domain-containing protein [Terriglobales bacterium]|nr:VWA domain-containing protein [Terriglobales bacterium]
MLRNVTCKLSALAGLFAMLAAQNAVLAQQSPDAQVPAPTIRVTTHLVLVDVVVTDKQGKPVLGLKPENFALEENGKAQKITTFVTPEQNQPPAPGPALPPGIYSNRAQYRSPGGPITVLLLDATNTQFKDQAYARRQMLRFAREQYKPGQRMAVFTLTDSLHLLQDFTTDPQLLYTALQGYVPQERPFGSAVQPTTPVTTGTPTPSSAVASLDTSTPPANETATSATNARGMPIFMVAGIQNFADAAVSYDLERRTDITFQALDALARALGGLPGRKNVIWVTGDLPFTLNPENRNMTEAQLSEELPSFNTRRVDEHSSGNYAATARRSGADQIRDADARLAAAQIALYPVDARGLSISLDQDAQEVMREMARDTGGRAYVNQNEIKLGVERAMEDTSATYTLGYYPTGKKWDGKYRSIKLKVDRQGLDLQHRRGYFALDPTQLKGYKPGQEVAAALGEAVPATQVAFSARVLPSPGANGKLGLDFLVDASTLSVEEDSGGKKMNVLFYATAFSQNGKMLGSQSQKVEQTFKSDVYEQIMQHGMMLHMDLAPPGNATQLRLAVQDGRTGLVGTIEAPLQTQ